MGLLYDGYGPGRVREEPETFATVRYTDTDNNGFLDKIEYDLDGDTIFETEISLHNLGLDDVCDIINTACFLRICGHYSRKQPTACGATPWMRWKWREAMASTLRGMP